MISQLQFHSCDFFRCFRKFWLLSHDARTIVFAAFENFGSGNFAGNSCLGRLPPEAPDLVAREWRRISTQTLAPGARMTTANHWQCTLEITRVDKSGEKAAGGKKCNYQLVLARLLPKPAAEPLSQLRMNGVDVDMLPCPSPSPHHHRHKENLVAEFSQFYTLSPKEEEAVAGFIVGCANSGKPGPAGTVSK